MSLRSILVLIAVLAFAAPALGQTVSPMPAPASAGLGPYSAAPQPYEILGISVEGIENESTRNFVVQTSGLQVGNTVTIPGDQAFSDAIRSIYRLGQFSDVQVVEERRVGDGVYLAIKVQEEPKLVDYTFQGMKKGHRKDVEEQAPLLKGTAVRPSDIERTIQVIEDYYAEKGYLMASAGVDREQVEENGVRLTFEVDRGPRVEIGDIDIEGNQDVSDFRLRRQMKETKEDRWWRFWSKATFERDKFEEDLQKIIAYYNEKGYYDAQIVHDSMYVAQNEGEPEVVVQLRVEEGPQYHIRNIEWEGNTVYTDQFLSSSLGFEEGDVYNSAQLEQNLYQNKQSSDVMSMYMNRGYMRFQVQPHVQVVEGDSLDLHFEVYEGEVYEFGDIDIAGNTKTKEHVIRRELYTVPGQTFSRELIQESIRRLSQLNYFNQESLGAGPSVEIDEQNKKVDLTYNLEETGSDQLELSGTWGSFGLVLMLRFNFNNFSAQNLFNREAWDPLPAGDGQQFSVAVQTNGTFYQSYSLSFTEPWFRGRPTPVGFGLSYSRYGNGGSRYFSRFGTGGSREGGFETGSARVFYEQRLKWPDDKFSTSTGIRYQFYQNDSLFSAIPNGTSQFVTLSQGLSRNSLDHPVFPQSGSSLSLTGEIAPPVANFIQYHKWRFKTNWYVPLIKDVTIGVGTDFGYVGSLTGDPVEFERFIVGGSPFDTQGFNQFFGRDIVYMRGYPSAAISPKRQGEAVGGTILNKYTSELRWQAIQSEQLTAAPYLFMDAANTWNGFDAFNPVQLYRSAGVGMKLFLPIIGMLELTYGYNFDQFTPISGREGQHNGMPRWYFQFSLGQGFGN